MCLESVQVHGVGVKQILVNDFLVVPTFRDVDFVGVCFLGLLLSFFDDVTVLIIIDGVIESVIGIVELLHPVS